MRAVQTENSNHVFGPPSGHEDNIGSLPCEIRTKDDARIVRSIWKLSDEERTYIAAGGTIELDVYWLGAMPPVSLNCSDEKEIQ